MACVRDDSLPSSYNGRALLPAAGHRPTSVRLGSGSRAHGRAPPGLVSVGRLARGRAGDCR